MKFYQRLLIGFCCLLGSAARSQSSLPNGVFLRDSVRIGQTVEFAFSYRHPPEATVFFPDISYNFAPFELVDKQLFPTVTNETGSLDSVIYLLKTFVVKPRLTLSLPVYLATEADSSVFSSVRDTVRVIELIRDDALQSDVPRDDFSMVETDKPLDYWKYLKVVLLTLSIAGSIYLFFGNFIYRQYRLLLYRKRHRDFTIKFKRYIKGSDTSQNVNQALILWKTYLQTLEGVPYTTSTTKEIIEAIPNERLGEALRTMDMNIYGDVQSSQMTFAMSKLLDIANERYAENRKLYEAQLKENRNR
jgi:hypothetical protein